MVYKHNIETVSPKSLFPYQLNVKLYKFGSKNTYRQDFLRKNLTDSGSALKVGKDAAK